LGTGFTVGDDSSLYVDSGGTSSGTTVLFDGLEAADGGTAIGTTVSEGGSQLVENGGTAVGTTVFAGGSQVVTSQTSHGATLGSALGSALGTLVTGSGAVAVVSPGLVTDMTVVNGGSALFYGARASGTLISGGTVSAYGYYVLDQSDGSSHLNVIGAEDNTTVTNGGLFIFTGANATGTVLNSGGVKYVVYGSSVSATVRNGGTQIFADNDEDTQVLSGGVEVVSAPTSGLVTGLNLQAGATIDLPAYAYASYISAGLSESGNELVLSGAISPTEIASLSGAYTDGNFVTEEDPNGNTEIVVTAACYARGTRLLTARGEVPVEALRADDRMVTDAGDHAAIRWIGMRRVDCRRHPRPELVWPVRVAAGAFADGVPRRDLLLSPDHAVFADGVLIPVQHLINGHSIAALPVAGVEYWHVELGRHGILLAEGLPTESYLDTGNRTQFDNAGTVIGLHPDFAPRSWNEACARLVQSGPEVVALKRRLFARACVETAPQLALRVTADDRPCAARRLAAGRWRIKIPAGARDLRLQSQPWMPAACLAESLDRRLLGVRVFAIATGGDAIPLDDPALRGFHRVEMTAEGICRWTNGDGLIALPPEVAAVTLRLGDGAIVLRPGQAPPLPVGQDRGRGVG